MEKVFKIVTCGNVDSGKSTLFGRLLHNTGNIYEDQWDDIVTASKRYSTFGRVEYGYLFDGLLAERKQQITIDNAHRFFNIGDIRFHLIDSPGHKQYMRNFIVGCAEADCAVLVIDATDGLNGQIPEHYEYCKLLRVRHLLCVITKADMVENLKLQSLADHIKEKFSPGDVICTSAVENTNVDVLRDKLVALASADERPEQWALCVQDNILTTKGRLIAGIEFGQLPGDEVTIYPSAIKCSLRRDENHTFLCRGEADVARGDIISNVPLQRSHYIHGKVVPFTDSFPKNLSLKIGTALSPIRHIDGCSVELRADMVYADVDSFKELGYGIIIDDRTKLTVGMVVIDSRTQPTPNKCYWFTGLHGSGKTTLAKAFRETFSLKPVLLDGDEIRGGVNRDLTLSKRDRDENVRRVAEMARILVEQGFDVCVACISKDADQRSTARGILQNYYVEIKVDASEDTRRKRDTKGFYRSNITLLAGYEPSDYPVIEVHTDGVSISESLHELQSRL